MSVPTGIDLTQLTAKIISESQNPSSELTSEIPQIIRDAERYCNRDLELQINRVILDTNFYAAGQTVNAITLVTPQCAYQYLPPDCVDVRLIEWYTPLVPNTPSSDGTDQLFGNANQLQRVSEDILSTFSPNKSTTGGPQYYYISGNQPVLGTGNPNPVTGVLVVAPTPDLGYAYRLHYATQQASLVDLGPGQFNYLSTWYPDILFYACMIRYAEFAKWPDEGQTWSAMYQAAIKTSLLEEIRRKGESFKDLSNSTEPLNVRNK